MIDGLPGGFLGDRIGGEDYQGKFSLIMDAGKVAFEETGQGTQELKTGDIRLLD